MPLSLAALKPSELNKRILAVRRALETRPRLEAALKRVPGSTALFRAFRLLLDGGYRSERRLIRARPDKLFQPSGRTHFDRHPRIFSFVRDGLPQGAALRLLSYGCSTGEEAFSLRTYFPEAEIVGIDINPRSIRVCRKKQARSGDTRMRFVHAAVPPDGSAGVYDAVFCHSVFRHGELGATRPETCSHLIRFADFDEIVRRLGRSLKAGGYLAITGSNFHSF